MKKSIQNILEIQNVILLTFTLIIIDAEILEW